MPDFEMPEPEPADEPPLLAREADAGSAAGVRSRGPAAAGDDRDRLLALRARWRRARTPALGVLIAVAVVVIGTIASGVVRDRDDRDAVLEVLDAYLDAVESSTDRGAPAASAVVPDAATASLALLGLDLSALQAPTVICDEPRIAGDGATAACRVRLDAAVETATIALERRGAAWSIASGLEVPVRIRSGILLVEAIAGVPIDEAIARGERDVWLLPGRYDVDARAPARFEIQRLDGLVVTPSGGAVRWTGDAAAGVEADVRAAALAFVDACAAAPSEGCPVLEASDATSFEAYAVVGRLRLDDAHALTYEVSLRRPIGEPREYVVVTVRVDFGEDLDRYDVAVL